MKKRQFLKIAVAVFATCMLINCERQSFDDTQNENIDFSFQLNHASLKSAIDSCENLSYATKILLTIETISGEETAYTDTELSLYKLNGNFFSPKIALTVGGYKLTKLLLLDDANNVLFASPLEGSLLAQNVTDPLPVEFKVVKDQAVSVNVEVVCALAYTPEDFGLVSFWFDHVKTFSFLVAVAEFGQDLILDASLSITSGSYNYMQQLEAIANNVVTISDDYDNYTLKIEKPGYQTFEAIFSNTDLKAHSNSPLVVELLKIKPLHDPVMVIQFDEHPITHNLHITSDGTYLYTINGGIASSGNINKYSMTGTLIDSYPIMVDGRGLSYNKTDGFLYASLFTGDIIKITNLELGEWEMIYENKLQHTQGVFAISPDGLKMYDFSFGTLRIWNFLTGDLLETITGLSHGLDYWQGATCIAVDESYLYTWDSGSMTVYVYDLEGNFIRTLILTNGNFGLSLSVFDGYLFTAIDGNYSVGTWYGYNIRNEITKSAPIVVKSNINNDIQVRSKKDDSLD